MMTIPTLLGSLAAIGIVVLIVRALRFQAKALSEEQAMRYSEEMIAGFDAIDAGLCRNRHSALVLGDDGRVVLLKCTGNRYAARALTPPARCRCPEQGRLIVDSDERQFGHVELRLDNAALWQQRLGGAA
ncbi:MAG: hypothetical protein OSA47_04755 [Novosphingopyxis baekryungensis]|jgi:hypothetical protein|nr:hypothetical protein [Novosphingopyxis baekryungensis]